VNESSFVIVALMFNNAAVVESDREVDEVPLVKVNVTVVAALALGMLVKNPNPNEATVTSAMRLKVVFVDIYFLSIVVIETFPNTALRWVARADTSLSPRE